MKTIIFIHGNSSSRRIFDPIINIWRNPSQISCLELPGHGEAERLADYSWQNIRKHILDEINNIEGEKLLIGHSLGGHYAIEIAPQLDSLKGLVVMGTPPIKLPLNLDEAFAPNPDFPTYFKEMPDAQELEKALNGVVYNKTAYSIIEDDFLKTDPKFRSYLGNSILNANGQLDEAELFSLLKCPKYIINGKQDATVNFEYLKQLQSEAEYPFELIQIDQCGHYATIEKPWKFAEILERICDEVFHS